MKIFMDWLANVFAPKAKKFTQMPAIAALSSAMQNLIPFILTGSVVFFYNVFRSYIPQLVINSWKSFDIHNTPPQQESCQSAF